MTNSEAWGRFFSALGTSVKDEGSHVVVEGVGDGPTRLIHADYPPSQEVVAAAAALAEKTGEPVMVLFGMPNLPTIRLTKVPEDGQMVDWLFTDKDGVAIKYLPPSRQAGETSDQFLLDLQWYCLQEDANGNVRFRPMVIEPLPITTVPYVRAVRVPTQAGELLSAVFTGGGMSPHGPRLVQALEAVGTRAKAA